MKKVVLLDDPINSGYRDKVKELLSDIAEVSYYEGVNGFSDSVMWRARLQFGEWDNRADWDLLYWSTGLWDHRRTLDDGEPFISAEHFLHYNRRLHRELTLHAKRLVYATATPAGEGYVHDPKGDFGIPREDWNREIKEYNDILTAYLKHEGVMIHDLYAFLTAHPEYLGKQGFFLTEEGADAVAEEVAGYIRRALAE